MLALIGDVAGQIWSYLEENENAPTTITTIAKKLGLKKEQVVYSLGWLAREGKVSFEESGTSVKVTLVK